MPGSWSKSCDPNDMQTFLEAITERYGNKMKINYVKGCEVEGDERSGFADALKVAAKSDVIVATMGKQKN